MPLTPRVLKPTKKKTMQKGEVQIRKKPVMHIAFVVTDLRRLKYIRLLFVFFAMPILAMHIARTLLYTLNTGKERLRASNLLPVHLLGEEEVDHDHPASKYCEDGDEEAEDGLPDDPECLKLNMGVDAWSVLV